MMLDDIRLEAPPDTGGAILNAPYSRLTITNWSDAQYGGPGESVGHLFISEPAKTWTEAERSHPWLGTLMSQPRLAGVEILDRVQDKFTPPISIVTLHARDRLRTILAGNRGFRNVNVQLPSGTPAPSFKGMVADVLTMYSAIHRASGSHFSPDQRTCGHQACPLFEINCCNSYPIVPLSFEVCGFARRMQHLVGFIRG